MLLEGPSDELVAMRAYIDLRGRMAIANGVDIINRSSAC
jgi:hypothetical protein